MYMVFLIENHTSKNENYGQKKEQAFFLTKTAADQFWGCQHDTKKRDSMTDFEKKFDPFLQKMTAEKLPGIVIENSRQQYKHLVNEKTGLIPETDINPVQPPF